MYNDLKIGTKVLAAFLFITIITAGFTGYFAFSYGKTFLERESFNKLTAVREMKAGQIEDYFKQITDQIITFSEDLIIIDAMQSFENHTSISIVPKVSEPKKWRPLMLSFWITTRSGLMSVWGKCRSNKSVMPDNVRKKGGCKCVLS